MLKVTIFLFFSIFSFSQTHYLSGFVLSELNEPLESANIIAKPLQDNTTLKYAIADNKGRYRIELETSVKYEITVSYIGYAEEVLTIEPNSNITSHNFKLKATGEKLKEIVIKHEFKPIIIKKDTIIYDVKSFANGNERKLKEQLEKLPGVEVDKNGNVTVQGKKVTKFLVEGDSFFGGGTKLGVENIPANAVDKVEVIDHFNEIGFMKQVSDSEDLAMNIKLKADKKKFIFGDIESGAEVANDNNFYLIHASLFYYTPKTNISYIGDINTIGRSTFSFQDLMRFEGGASSFLNGRKSISNLFSLVNDNTDIVKNKAQFSALNFNIDANSKLDISGYGIFSKIFTESLNENKNQYFQNNSIALENVFQNNKNQTQLGIGNIKLDYSPNNKEKWYYNAQYQSSTNDIFNTINSITNLNSNIFEALTIADNNSAKQYIEWHKNINNKNTTTFVVNHSYEKSTPTNNWITNELFLAGLIPLQNDSNYRIEQTKRIQNNSIDALFKYYWIINNFNHLYSVVGNNFGNSQYGTTEKQLISDGTINNFSSSGFGNDIHYKLNDAYIGFEYKFKIGKWTNKPGLYYHIYNLSTNQSNDNTIINKTLFQPQFNSDYEFNKSETLSFNYRLVNSFPEVNQLADRFILQNYNSVFKGNALLLNEQFHNANLRYSKMNLYRGITLHTNLIFNKKTKTTRNITELNGINQYNTPILTENPETNWRFSGSISKKIYRFKLGINTNLNWFNYFQSINNIFTKNERNNQTIGISFKTAYKKWPDLNISYKKGFSQFKGITYSNRKSNELNVHLELTLFKSFVYSFEHEYFDNRNIGISNSFNISNSSLRYQKKNNALGFELFTSNLFNVKTKNSFTFSDFAINEQNTYVLPRVIMFSLNYKL